MKKKVKIITVLISVILTQAQFFYPGILYALRPVSTISMHSNAETAHPGHQFFIPNQPKTTATYSVNHIRELIFNLSEAVKHASSAYESLRLQSLIKQLQDMIDPEKNSKIREFTTPFLFDKPHQDLEIGLIKRIVEKKGIVDHSNEHDRLNAAVCALNNKRSLFPRITSKTDAKDGIRKSIIELVIHDIETNQVIIIDTEMLKPGIAATTPDSELPENMLALEDARVLERDGNLCLYMTAVVKDEKAEHKYKYYSVITSHNTAEFLRIVDERLALSEEERKKTHANWQWSKPKIAITDGPYAKQNIKNFTPLGDRANGHYYAFYRPTNENDERKELILASSETSLIRAWKHVRKYMHVLKGWLGSSAFIAGMQEKRDKPWYDFTSIHYGEEKDNGLIIKFYDLWVLVSDRKDEHEKSIPIPLFFPEEDQAFEADGQGWKPGTIYSCGAILTEYDQDQGKFVFDVYYSGSDSLILLATVTLFIQDTPGNTIRNQHFVEVNETLLREIQACEQILANTYQPDTENSLAFTLEIDKSA